MYSLMPNLAVSEGGFGYRKRHANQASISGSQALSCTLWQHHYVIGGNQ